MPKTNLLPNTVNPRQNRWTTSLLQLSLALILSSLVSLSYLKLGVLAAAWSLAGVCILVSCYSLYLMPRKPIQVKAGKGMLRTLTSQGEINAYAQRFFVRTMLMLIPGILVLSRNPKHAVLVIVFVAGLTLCALSERYRIRQCLPQQPADLQPALFVVQAKQEQAPGTQPVQQEEVAWVAYHTYNTPLF